MVRTTRVRFPARWVDGSGAVRAEEADFRLGLGPCGKTVIELRPWIEQGDLRLTQVHDDGTSKVFYYRREDIPGRIELERVGC